MRVAILSQGYLTGGGVRAIATWLRRGLSDHGHEVEVHDLATSSRDDRSQRVLSPSTWRVSLEAERDPDDPGLFHWGAAWVELESQRYRPRGPLTDALNDYDLIQVVAGGPALALVASRAKPPKALQVATTLLAERRSRLAGMPPVKRIVKTLSLPRLHRLEVHALRAVDHVFVENRWMEEWVQRHGQPNVTFAPPGIDTHKFRPEGDWDANRPIIAFGRLGDSRKDWPTAVEAFERFVADTGLANGLVLAGRGPLDPALQRRLESSPVLERITIREDVPADELPALLASGSVFLQSSLEEGLGLAGLEAMACGLPVVATATVGASEYVRNGENGFLAPLGESVDALAAGLERVLGSGSGSAFSKQALRSVRGDYSSDAAIRRFLDTYADIVDGG